MSIISLEPFINIDHSEKLLAIDRINIMIYINLIPLIMFLLYYVLYNMDIYRQKPPSKY